MPCTVAAQPALTDSQLILRKRSTYCTDMDSPLNICDAPADRPSSQPMTWAQEDCLTRGMDGERSGREDAGDADRLAWFLGRG